MSSESSLLTTAASDSSSSADSPYRSRTQINNFGAARGEATSKPAQWSSPPVQASARRRHDYLRARGVVIAKVTPNGANQKVWCVCEICGGRRLVSKSTYYRHLRDNAESARRRVNWEALPRHDLNTASHRELL